MAEPDIILSQAEIEQLTGRRRPVDQLVALHAAGYVRARRAHTGRVILERAHFLAVCHGQMNAGAPRPKLRAA